MAKIIQSLIIIFLMTIWCIKVSLSDYRIWNYEVGGNGGNYFEYDRSMAPNGVIVKKLEVWSDYNTLTAIRITFSDEYKITAGKTWGKEYDSFELDVMNNANHEKGAELVDYLSVWGNGAGTRCSAFKIETNHGRTFWPKMTEWDLKTEYKMNFGGGLILGLRGRHGVDIDKLTFIMIKPIKSFELRNIQYDMSRVSSPRSESVYDITIPNPSDSDNDSGTITKEITETISGKIGITMSWEYSQKSTAKIGIPEIGEIGGEMQWKISGEITTELSWSKTVSDTIVIPLIIPARTKTRIMYYYYTGIADLTWSGTMYVTLDGGIWSYAVSGEYNGKDVTRITGDSKVVAHWINNTWIDVPPQQGIIYKVPIRYFHHELIINGHKNEIDSTP